MRIEREIELIRTRIIEAFGRSIGIWGLNETYGRIFGLLYFADEPISLEEIARDLMVSKATVSINIRVLERLRAVQKVWQKGSRKDYYVVERDFEKILQEMLRTTAMDELSIHKASAAEALACYEGLLQLNPPSELQALIRGDLEKLHEFIRWIQIGERWMQFFMKTDVTEVPVGEVRHIQVEWEDEG